MKDKEAHSNVPQETWLSSYNFNNKITSENEYIIQLKRIKRYPLSQSDGTAEYTNCISPEG